MRWSWKRPSIPEEYREWIQENRWWLQFLSIAILALIIVIAFRRGAWLDWVGFQGKTVWDWLNLLGVPLTLAILGYSLQLQEQKRTETLAREQRERAADEEKEEILQTYFDRISVLLVDKNLLAIASKAYPQQKDNEERSEELTEAIQAIQDKSLTVEEKELLAAAVDVIRARTLSILRRFEQDGARKGSVIRFLIEAEVISKAKLNLSNADLSSADLRHADLSGANLSAASFSGAILYDANLSGANLSAASLSGANLFGADLSDADLSGANLYGADLYGADLSDADLSGANLCGADLRAVSLTGVSLYGADLSDADLRYANLPFADLSGVNLSEAILYHADLTGAKLTVVNLRNIRWNEHTKWPTPEEVAKARNIPEALKQQLGIE